MKRNAPVSRRALQRKSRSNSDLPAA